MLICSYFFIYVFPQKCQWLHWSCPDWVPTVPQVHVLQCTTMYYIFIPPKRSKSTILLKNGWCFDFSIFFAGLSMGIHWFLPIFPGFSHVFSGRRHCSLHPRSGAPEADGQCHGPGLATCELPSGDAEDTATGWQVGEHWWNIWDIYGIYIYILTNI